MPDHPAEPPQQSRESDRAGSSLSAASTSTRANPAPPAAATDPRERLWRSSDPAVDAALRAALGTCRPEERPDLVRVMLNRQQLAGQVAVVETQDQAGTEEQAWVLEAARNDLDGALRTLIGRAEGEGTRHALRLIREAKLGRLAYLLTELIRRGRDGLTGEAAEVLVELCGVRDPAAREAVRSAVDTAVARFDRHRHAGVVEAYLKLLPARMPAALGALRTPDHPATEALGQRLSAAATAVDRRALLPLCACEALHGPIRVGLLACRDAEALDDVLKQGPQLVEPSVGNMLGGVPAAQAGNVADVATVQALSPASRRWVPFLWSKLPLESAELLERMASLVDDDDLATRMSALRVVSALRPTAELRGPWADLLIRFAHDPDARIARAAAAVLDRAASPMTPKPTPFRPVSETNEPAIPLATVSRLATSPHEPVRATAGRRIGPGAFARVWDHWASLEPGRRAATLFALRKLDPGFDQRLLRRLHDQDARRDPNMIDPRLRSLAWVRALGCPTGPISDTALAMTADADARVAASAVMAAAMADAPGTTELLHRLTKHADARVRANAVEALDQRLELPDPAKQNDPSGAWPPSRLEDLCRDDAPRVRANALLACFRRDGQPTLKAIAEMLRDPRPDHRRSALWLAGVTGLIDATRGLADTTQTTVDTPEHDSAAIAPAAFEPAEPEPPGVAELLQALDHAIDEARGAAA